MNKDKLISLILFVARAFVAVLRFKQPNKKDK